MKQEARIKSKWLHFKLKCDCLNERNVHAIFRNMHFLIGNSLVRLFSRFEFVECRIGGISMNSAYSLHSPSDNFMLEAMGNSKTHNDLSQVNVIAFESMTEISVRFKLRRRLMLVLLESILSTFFSSCLHTHYSYETLSSIAQANANANP